MTLEMRKWVKDGDTDKIKQQIFSVSKLYREKILIEIA